MGESMDACGIWNSRDCRFFRDCRWQWCDVTVTVMVFWGGGKGFRRMREFPWRFVPREKASVGGNPWVDGFGATPTGSRWFLSRGRKVSFFSHQLARSSRFRMRFGFRRGDYVTIKQVSSHAPRKSILHSNVTSQNLGIAVFLFYFDEKPEWKSR